ncbi:MAG: hypothetical protein D6814_15275 [Calditrichaeota bacterium]|nr:MAG: hypothetical protein D6814_15275 [Calditrichota bacterium]
MKMRFWAAALHRGELAFLFFKTGSRKVKINKKSKGYRRSTVQQINNNEFVAQHLALTPSI